MSENDSHFGLHTTHLMEQVPLEKAQKMKLRTIQGGILVFLGGTMGVGSFGFMFLAVIRGLQFDRWLMAFIAFLMAISIGLVLIGATWWSTQLMGSATRDGLAVIKGISGALLPWKREGKDG